MTSGLSTPPSLTSVPLVRVAVNAALASIKILAGFFGNSYALIACGLIVVSGVNLLRMAVRELLDAAPAKDFEEKVRELASGVDGVRALDKCRIRTSGTRSFVELHVEVNGRATVQAGHDIGGRVRSALRGLLSSSLRGPRPKSLRSRSWHRIRR